MDVVRQRLDPVRERPLVGHQVALRRPAQAQGKLVSYTTYQLPPSGKWWALASRHQSHSVQNSDIGESFVRTMASRFGSAQQSSDKKTTHGPGLVAKFKISKLSHRKNSIKSKQNINELHNLFVNCEPNLINLIRL